MYFDNYNKFSLDSVELVYLYHFFVLYFEDFFSNFLRGAFMSNGKILFDSTTLLSTLLLETVYH